MKKVILDTNFLMIPFQFRVDVISEIDRICDFRYKLATTPEVIEELTALSEKGNGKDHRAAKAALELARKHRITRIKNRKIFKNADEAILSIADENLIVATQDRILRKKLKQKKVRLIILRQKKYLKFLGE